VGIKETGSENAAWFHLVHDNDESWKITVKHKLRNNDSSLSILKILKIMSVIFTHFTGNLQHFN
jgi:hypothetical protein